MRPITIFWIVGAMMVAVIMANPIKPYRRFEIGPPEPNVDLDEFSITMQRRIKRMYYFLRKRMVRFPFRFRASTGPNKRSMTDIKENSGADTQPSRASICTRNTPDPTNHLQQKSLLDTNKIYNECSTSKSKLRSAEWKVEYRRSLPRKDSS